MSADGSGGNQRRGRTAVAVDDVDRQIVRLLQNDGRMSVRMLAEQVNISRASAYARLERLRESGVITGFRAVIDPQRYGFGLAAYISAKQRQRSWKTFGDRVRDMPQVEHAAVLSPEYDMLLLVRIRDPDELRDIILEQLHAMPEGLTTHTMLVLDEIHR